MKDKFHLVINFIEQGKEENAREEFQKIASENTVEYWMTKGKLEQKFQNWGEALNAFQKILELDSENREAENNIRIIQNIINFWNPEMFNP